MGFFNDLGKKTSETTSRIAKETKLKIKINENKGKISDLYSEIGKKMYQKHLTEEVIYGDLTDDFTNIDNLSKEIEDAQAEILKVNQKKKCIKCGEEMIITSQFCPKCGEKQPEEQPVVETTSEIKEETKTEPTQEIPEGTNNTENNNQ